MGGTPRWSRAGSAFLYGTQNALQGKKTNIFWEQGSLCRNNWPPRGPIGLWMGRSRRGNAKGPVLPIFQVPDFTTIGQSGQGPTIIPTRHVDLRGKNKTCSGGAYCRRGQFQDYLNRKKSSKHIETSVSKHFEKGDLGLRNHPGKFRLFGRGSQARKTGGEKGRDTKIHNKKKVGKEGNKDVQNSTSKKQRGAGGASSDLTYFLQGQGNASPLLFGQFPENFGAKSTPVEKRRGRGNVKNSIRLQNGPGGRKPKRKGLATGTLISPIWALPPWGPQRVRRALAQGRVHLQQTRRTNRNTNLGRRGNGLLGNSTKRLSAKPIQRGG